MERIRFTRFEVYRSNDNYFCYRYLANGFKIFRSKSHNSLESCLAALKRLRSFESMDSLFQRCTLGTRYFFNLRTQDGELLGISEIFNNQEDMDTAIALVEYEAGNAPVVNLVTSNTITRETES